MSALAKVADWRARVAVEGDTDLNHDNIEAPRMTEIKTFPTVNVASCATGIILRTGLSYADMAEVAEHALGHSIWTHELGDEKTMNKVRAAIHEQFPEIPTREEAQADWQAASDRAIKAYGETVDLKLGVGQRTETPMDSLVRMTGAA